MVVIFSITRCPSCGHTMRFSRANNDWRCGYCPTVLSAEAGRVAMKQEQHGEDEQPISVKDMHFFDKPQGRVT